MSLTPEEAHAQAVQRIALAYELNWRSLELDELEFKALPSELATLSNLGQLSLNGCKSLSDVSPLAALTQLTSLDLGGCESLSDVSPLAALTQLTSLNLLGCESLSDLPPLAALTQLTYLGLRWCSILSNVSSLAALTHFTELSLFGCKSLSDVSPLAALTQLTSLELPRTNVSDVSPLATLTQLTSLDLGGCESLSDVSPLAALTQLTSLNLGWCSALSDVSPLAALTQLTSLGLDLCRGIRQFAPLIPILPQLTALNLYGCKFSDLPSSVCGSGAGENAIDEVRAYYADLDAGAQADAEVKLFILGNGGVGKTQLRYRLCDPDYELDPSIPTTHGVELDRFATELDDKRTDVRVNLWDFGGQDIYHGTHAHFLDGHAVFLVLWHPDFEHGEFTDPQSGVRMRNRPLAYWLDYVRAQAGPDAVVLLVQARADSRADEHDLPAVDLGGLRVRTLRVSSLTGRGLGTLREQLKEAVRDLLDARPPYQIGVGRAKVRDRLRDWIEQDQQRPPAERTHRTITTDEFAALCNETGGVSSADALLTFLHRSGVVFYRPGLFGDRVVLDQQWALNAIYTVFDRARVLPEYREHGRFTRSGLAALAWHEYPIEEQELFLGMMRECDICFEIGKRRIDGDEEAVYLAPELLPDDRDAVRRVLFGRKPDSEPAVTAVAKFPFLHDGVLRSVLAALGRKFGDLATYWKWGCFLYDEAAGCRATLEAARGGPDDGPGGGTITLRVWGRKPDGVLAALTEVVNRSAGRQEPAWTSRTEPRVEPDFVVSRRGEGSAPPLTPGVPPDDEAVVAISYGHGDDRDEKGRNRGQFVDGLERAMREWGFHALRDVNELRDGGLIREFVPTLVQRPDGRPRRVVLVLSEKYLRSVYCMAELHAVWQLSLGNRAAFARSAIPCVIEDNLEIDDWRGRTRWADYWKAEYEAMTAAGDDLCADDRDLRDEIDRWRKDVGRMLTFVSNMVTDRGYARLTADGFAAVRRMLDRPGRG